MPQILVNGELKDVTQEEYDAWTSANPGTGEAPAGGDVLQVPTQPKILIPNTSNTSPEQELKKLYEEFEVEPPPESGADYYGQELVKPEDLVAKDLSTQLYTNVDPAVPLSKPATLVAKDISTNVNTGIDPSVPRINTGSFSVANTNTTLAATTNNQRLYGGQNLTTEPVRNPAPATGDTLSAGGSLALTTAAAIGTYLAKQPAGTLAGYYNTATEAAKKLIGQDTTTLLNEASQQAAEVNYGDIEYGDALFAEDGLNPAEIDYGEVNYGDELFTEAALEEASIAAGEVDYGDATADDPYNNEAEFLSGNEYVAEPEATTPPYPILTAEEYFAIYKPTNPMEEGATYGTMIVSEELLIAASSPEAIAAQLELNAIAEADNPGDPTANAVLVNDSSITIPDEAVPPDQLQNNEFVPQGDLFVAPEDVPVEQQGDTLVDLNSGEVYAIDPESGFVDNNGLLITPEEIPTEQQGDTLVDLNSGEVYGIDPASGFVDDNGLLISPEDIPVTREGDVLVDLNTGEEYPIDPESGYVEVNGLLVSPEDIPVERQGDVLVDLNTGEEYPIDAESGFVEVNGLLVSPEDIGNEDPAARIEAEGGLVEFTENGPVGRSAGDLAAAAQQAAKEDTQAQAALQLQRNQASQGDWRVRLRLAPNANYLYKDEGNLGILQPLKATDGVIFPYLPQINTSYHANYNPYDLTHSNYRGYFYQNSYVGEISITAPFTAQDTEEAGYLLAVIHFFRSVTKMFYGQDPVGRGSPPPLVYLQGLGQYQFNLHPCVVSNFTYNLPNDVDYIRSGTPDFNGTNMLARRDKQSTATNPFSSAMQRLSSIGQPKGAVNIPPPPPTLGQDGPTYVPTKMEIQLTLLPVQSREQVSKQFSMSKFSNGHLLKGGFW